MKYINKIGVVLTAGLVLAAASCTDYDDYNTVPSDERPEANQTLWENINNDPQLTKFAALAKQCNFSEALNSARFYTVWAPVDAAFSEADYQRLSASDSATVLKQFMQHHVTEYNYPVSASLEPTTIVSLNDKHHDFTSTAFDEFTYGDTNIPASNGVMHKINGMSEFFYNLYENIDNLKNCDSIKHYIQKYDEYYLDVNSSVIGPLVDGKQTYLDSVMKKRNNVVNTIMRASLDNEDSTYCMLIPNDKAWSDAYKKILPLYNYIPKMDFMDLNEKSSVASSTTATAAKSATPATTTGAVLQDSLTCRNIVNNLVFSHSNVYNLPMFGEGSLSSKDSVRTTSGRFLQHAQEVLDHTLAVNEMSNGITRTIDSITFKPWQSYNPVLSAYGLHTLKVKKLTSHSIALDSLAGRDSLFSEIPGILKEHLFPQTSRFFSYIAVDSADVDGTTGKPEFNFAIDGVRSTTYRIFVVTVPAQVENPAAAVKPYYLRFYLSYADADNKQQYIVLPQGAKTTSAITTDNTPAKKESNTVYLENPGRVHAIDLGEFTFPACYYGLDAYPSLMMMHTKTYTSSGNRAKYDQQMRVAGVYLIPKEYYDDWANSANE